MYLFASDFRHCYSRIVGLHSVDKNRLLWLSWYNIKLKVTRSPSRGNWCFVDAEVRGILFRNIQKKAGSIRGSWPRMTMATVGVEIGPCSAIKVAGRCVIPNR